MSNRRQFQWAVPIQREDGRTVMEEVKSYWDPAHDTTRAGVENTARVQVQCRAKMGASVTGRAELLTA